MSSGSYSFQTSPRLILLISGKCRDELVLIFCVRLGESRDDAFAERGFDGYRLVRTVVVRRAEHEKKADE
jgi:hypothetical protein